MDLSKYLSSGAEPAAAEQQPRMSKEEYAALKKQEREEVWAEIDAKAQDVFKDGDSLKGSLILWHSASLRKHRTCSCFMARIRRSGR